MLLIKLYLHFIAIIKKVIYKIIYKRKIRFGRKTTFRKGFSLMIDCNAKVIIGDNCFFNNYCTIDSVNLVEIGDETIFGENVKLYDHNHKYSDLNMPLKKQGNSYGPIKIGKHVWVGSNVTILKGVSIGDNVVIGANCLIYKSIPGNTVVKSSQHLLYTEYQVNGCFD